MMPRHIPTIVLSTAALLLTGAPLASAGPADTGGPQAAPQPSCQESTLFAYKERICWTTEGEDSQVTVTMQLQDKITGRCTLTADEPLCRAEGISGGNEHETRVTVNFEKKTVQSDYEVCAPPKAGSLEEQCDEKEHSYRF